MQRQEINLFPYLQEPKAIRSFLSWKMLWFYNLIFLIVFIIIYLFSLWELHHLRRQIISMQKQIPQLEKKFVDVKNKYPQFLFSQDATQSMQQMQQDLLVHEKILSNLIDRQPFSQVFLALSRNIVNNVWLTDFIIGKGNSELTFKGKSIGIENLQKFLNNLSKEKTFTDFAITVKGIENITKENATGTLNFELTLTKKGQ